MSKIIFCLFSINNHYDQPRNNLVCFWHDLTLQAIETALEGEPPAVAQSLFADGYYRDDSVELRIEKISPGVVLKND